VKNFFYISMCLLVYLHRGGAVAKWLVYPVTRAAMRASA
jgi:hypothetical protein